MKPSSSIGCFIVLFMPMACSGQAYNYPDGSLVDDFTVTDLGGNMHNLYDYTAEGKYVFLDFFTVGCAPCAATLTYFAELHERYGCNAHEVVCLSVDLFSTDAAADIFAWTTTNGGGWELPPVIAGVASAALGETFGVGNAPNYCLIGPDNVMINNFIWVVTSLTTFESNFPLGSGITMHDCLSGINDGPAVNDELTIAPNPFRTTTHVTCTTPIRQWILSDATGRVVERSRSAGNSFELSPPAPGIYRLTCLTVKGLLSRQVVMVR